MKPYDKKSKISEYIQERKLRKRWRKITAALAIFVALVTTAAMILPAVTMEKNSYQANEHSSWATAYKPGYELPGENLFTIFPTTVMNLTSSLAENSGEGVHFGEYITGFTVEVLHGNQWVLITNGIVVSGDSVRVNLAYTIPPGVVDERSQTIYYQLPAGIGLSKESTGHVMNGSIQVGKYTISTSGLITIVFNPDFAQGGEAFTGTVGFQGIVTATGSEEGDKIDFGFDGGVITVVPNEEFTDLSVKKTGWYESGAQAIGYTITVSTTEGTDGPVNVCDIFQTANINYDMDFTHPEIGYYPFTVKWFNTDGTQSIQLDVTPQVMPAHGTTPASFNLADLPALGPGERYEITYAAVPDLNTVAANGELVIKNNVTVKDKSKESQASADVTVSPVRVSKKGKYDENTQKIIWTITLYSFDGQPIRLNDELAWYDKSDMRHPVNLDSVTAYIEVLHPDGSVDKYPNVRLEFPYTIGAEFIGKGDYCTIAYETELPVDIPKGEQIRVENTAYSNNYEAETSVEINTPGEYNLTKILASDVSNNLNPLIWNSQIQYPKTIANADKLTYMDIMVDVARYDGSVTLDSHYNTANTLKQFLSVSCGNTALVYGQDYYVYVVTRKALNDALGTDYGAINYKLYENLYKDTNLLNLLNDTVCLWQRVNSDDPLLAGQYATGVVDSNEHLGAFLIVFNNSIETGLKLQQAGFVPIDITYQTYIDADKLDSLSGMVRAANIAKIQGDSAMAWASTSLQDTLSKQVSATGPVENGDGTVDTSFYTSEPIHINTGQTHDLIYYRILLSGISDNTETIVDILPAGMTIVKDSVCLAEHVMGSDQTSLWVSESQNPTVIRHAEDPLPDGRTRVTFTISRGGNDNLVGVPLGIYYTVSVADDPNLTGDKSKNYENIVKWDDLESSTNTIVTHTETVLQKDGIQVTDKSGNITDRLRYSVIVNPQGLDLDQEHSEIHLKDVLTVPEGVNPQFRPETVGVYYYDPDNEENYYMGQEMETSRYRLSYDSDTYTINFILPDQVACVVTYEYQVDRGSAAGSVNIYNQASLNGQSGTTSGSTIIIEDEHSQATANKATLTIFKYGGDNQANLLDGVLFELARFEQLDGGHEWKQTSITASGRDGYFITGGDGVTGAIILNFLDDKKDENSHYNTLYRLTEHESLPGYQLDATPRYYVWMEQNATRESTIQTMGRVWMQAGIDPASVVFIEFGENITEYIKNEPTTTGISVTKLWQNKDGETLTENLPSDVTVTLYQHVNGVTTPYEAENVTNPVTLSADNNWYYIWDGLPKEINGQTIAYTVVEESVEGWEITYTYPEGQNDDTGIAGGNVIITNIKMSSFVLPETGGVGPTLFTVAGVLLASASSLAYLYLRRRRRMKGEASSQ